MFKTVSEMYNYAKANDIKLLSDFDADFWEDYVANYDKYDGVFKRLYKSFVYFEQLDDEDIEDVVEDFTQAVEGHLMINEKKYSELYRMNVVTDTEYSLLGNVDITEVMDKEGGKTEGQRSDSETRGQKENSESLGQKINSESLGQRQDSDSLGQREDSESLGRRIDDSESHVGTHTDTKTNEVSPYNNESFYNNEKVTDVSGPRIDTVQNTLGAQQNTRTTGSQSNSHTTGSQSNSYTEGSQQNTFTEGSQQNSFVKGSQTDSYSEDYTFTRRGNNGIAAADMLNKHHRFWSLFEFYSYIFGEIAKEMLLND